MVSTITRQDLRDRVERGDSLVVEALPRSYYDEAHLPGALNLPHDADPATIATTLPDRGRAVVVYCANEPCPNSGILARRLDQAGYAHVYEYAGGKQDWIEAGLPVESVNNA